MLEYFQDETGEVVATIDPVKTQELRKKKYEYFLKKSGIPEFYWDIDFNDYKGDKQSESFKKIKYYSENILNKEFKYVHLYLWGIQGTQKTALECNVLKEALKKGLKVKFILAGDLIDLLLKLQGFNYNEVLYEQAEDLKNNYDIIAIDDIGDIQKSLMWKGDSKNIILSEWDRFLRKVLYNGTKIIMTSNFDVTIFKEYFGESIYAMIDRNFEKIQLIESVKDIRKFDVSVAFEGMKRRK